MEKNKLFVLLPDGVGLRNFAYSGFHAKAIAQGYDIVFWNNTPVDIKALGFSEIRIRNSKLDKLTDVLKKAKVQIELTQNIRRSNDKVYDFYRFPIVSVNLKTAVKNMAVRFLSRTNSSESGLFKIRKKINEKERNTLYYRQSIETLKKEQPAAVFCTNQRHASTIAPLLAAKDLGIPTAVFIYSWDNLPKATMVVETDYYFVWSEYMKKELMYYYPYISEDQIFITGSPQFEMHFKEPLQSREEFFGNWGLDGNKKYICFTGDDITTSPDDPKYLEDLAVAVKELNGKGYNLGILFRKCPVDFSDRYQAVLKKYAAIIVSIDPLWRPLSHAWNTILPTKEDNQLLANLAEHSEMVVNLGSSTVFDFIIHQKPCGYFKYNQPGQQNPDWDIFKCYRFVHFRSMPSPESVFWIESPESLAGIISQALQGNENVIENAALWFETINQHPADEASDRILNAIKKIIEIHREPSAANLQKRERQK